MVLIHATAHAKTSSKAAEIPNSTMMLLIHAQISQNWNWIQYLCKSKTRISMAEWLDEGLAALVQESQDT